MKKILSFFLIVLFIGLDAQEKQNSMILPIFPGCEGYKNPSKRLTDCLGQTLTQLILDRIDKKELDQILKSTDKKEAHTKIKFSINKEGKLIILV